MHFDTECFKVLRIILTIHSENFPEQFCLFFTFNTECVLCELPGKRDVRNTVYSSVSADITVL